MRGIVEALSLFAYQVRTSLRFRLVFLTTVTIVLGAVISGLGTFQAARISFYSQLDAELLSIAESISGQIGVDFEEGSVRPTSTLNVENVVVMVVGANRNEQVIVGDDSTKLVIGPHEVAVARIQTGSSAHNGVSVSGVPYRIMAVPFVDANSQDAYALVIARELSPTTDGLARLATLQWGVGLAAVAVCVFAAVLVAGATLNPIRNLTSAVTSMTESDQLTTIEVRGSAEVAELERSFNSLMESLNTARTQQNRLIADASHELRTPLTSLRTNIELLIADASAQMLPAGARSEILSDAAAQLGEFTSLINDLVVLSRGDAPPSSMVLVDFTDVVRRAVVRSQRRGPGLNFDVALQYFYVKGDAAMLERAVTNLLDNAVKFSPAGGTITVSLDEDGLSISDEGPGVADKDIPHVFERFYRSDSSRNTPGTGLGLSIVAHTVTAHGGTVEVSRADSGGAEFTVHLPEVEGDDGE